MAWIGVVTNGGQAMLDAYALGGHTLALSRCTVGSGTVSEANLRTQTAVSEEKATGSIVGAEAVENGVKYKLQVGPAASTAYVARQIGLWARLDGGNETLLLLCQENAGGVSVPTAAVSPNFAFGLYAALAVDNTEDLSVNIDETAYVTNGTLAEELAKKLDKAKVYNDLDQSAAGYALDARQGKALKDAVDAKVALVVNCGTITALPKTVNNAAITSDMVVVESVVGTPSAMGSDWTVTTANGSLTISGTISGSSTLVLTLMHG